MKKETNIFVIVSLIVALLVVLAFLDYYLWNYLTNGFRKPSLADVIGAFIAIEGIGLYVWRNIIQTKQKIDDRFNNSVNLLGSQESSARTGAIYSLHALALENKKYRNDIAEILCSHIRTKTTEPKYKHEHKYRPSNEIRSAINLLFREANSLYKLFSDLPTIELSFSYLRGAYFKDAKLQGATFYKAECQGTNFRGAQCQEVRFHETQCQGANFQETQCQGASFNEAQCQGAYFYKALFHGAEFQNTQCQGAILKEAQFQGAIFSKTQFQGVFTKIPEKEIQHLNYHSYYLSKFIQWLKDRIGKDTELDNIVFTGEVSEVAINAIEEAHKHLSEKWYNKMKNIIKKNKYKSNSYAPPKEMGNGILENSDELKDIIKELEEIERRWRK